jgi:hypothetical protein
LAVKYAWLRQDVVTVCEKVTVRPKPATRASTVIDPMSTAALAIPPAA